MEVSEMGEVVESGIGNDHPEPQDEQRSSRGPALNEVRLLGRLAADPAMKYTPDGKAISELRMVTNERPDPEYHDLVAYGRLAEVVGEYVRKGSLVFVQGRLHGRLGRRRTGRTGGAWSWSPSRSSSLAASSRGTRSFGGAAGAKPAPHHGKHPEVHRDECGYERTGLPGRGL
jgi:single-stranded DNA-binding protein